MFIGTHASYDVASACTFIPHDKGVGARRGGCRGGVARGAGDAGGLGVWRMGCRGRWRVARGMPGWLAVGAWRGGCRGSSFQEALERGAGVPERGVGTWLPAAPAGIQEQAMEMRVRLEAQATRALCVARVSLKSFIQSP
jgi:hypothetical protein